MKTAVVLCALSALLLATLVAAVEPFSAEARQHVVAQLGHLRKSELGGWESLEATFDALSAYEQLDAPAVPQGSKLCAGLQKALNAAVPIADLDDIHHAAGSAVILKCNSFTVPSSIKAVLQAGLDDKDVEDIYHASQAVFALAELKNTVALKDFDFSRVGSNLIALLEEDGTFRSTPEDEEGSAYHAGLALEVLGELSQKVSGAVDKALIRQAADKVQALIKTGVNAEQKKVDFSHGAPNEVSPLEAVATVLDGLRALSAVAAEPLDVKKPQLIAIGDFVLRHAFVSNAEDADAFSSALLFLANNPIFIPYYVQVKEASTSGNFKFSVTNIIDQPTTRLSVLVESAKKAGGKGPGLRDLVIQPASDAEDNTEYVLNNSSAAQLARVQPGFYDFKLNLVPSSKGGAKSDKYKPQAGVDVRAKIMWEPTLGQRLEISISSSAKANAKEGDLVETLRYPDHLEAASAQTFDASKHLSLRLKFEKNEPRPTSVFLHLWHVSEKEAMFLLKPLPEEAESDSVTFVLKLSFGSSELIEALAGAGTYTASVVFGDATLERLITWKVAYLNLNIPSSAAGSFDAHFAPKPTFLHSFRTPDPRPSAFVSLIFTLATLAPFGGLLVALASSGVKFSLPSNPSEFLYAAVFQGSILAILLSYTLYWLSLNIFQALALLATCGIVAIFSGTGALRMLNQRTNKGKKHSE